MAEQQYKIIEVTQPGCRQCIAVDRWFKERDVPFTKVDVTTNPDLAETVRELGYMAAPVVLLKQGDVVVDHFHGFDVGRLEEFRGRVDTVSAVA